MENSFNAPLSLSQDEAQVKSAKFMGTVYIWMMLGVAFSGCVAWSISQNTEFAYAIVTNQAARWGMFIIQLSLVIGIRAMINRINALVAGGLYFVYAGVTGATLSVVFLMYAASSIYSMFFLTAFSFGTLSAVGWFTKKDLAPIHTFLMMGLFGMIGYGLLAMIFPSFGGEKGSMVLGVVGILVFSGLTAYDTQKIKALYNRGSGTEESERKLAIIGALTLYLDFINLFLSLLRVFGRRR